MSPFLLLSCFILRTLGPPSEAKVITVVGKMRLFREGSELCVVFLNKRRREKGILYVNLAQ